MEYGVPPAGNANFAWVQHFIHHLAPTGTAGFVLANGSMSSNRSGEGEISARNCTANWLMRTWEKDLGVPPAVQRDFLLAPVLSEEWAVAWSVPVRLIRRPIRGEKRSL